MITNIKKQGGFVLIGLPWLAGVISTFVASFVSFFALRFTKKVAVLASVLTALLALTTTFVIAIEALLSSITFTLPPYYHSAFIIVPENFSVCLGVIISAKALNWIYQWQKSVIQGALFV